MQNSEGGGLPRPRQVMSRWFLRQTDGDADVAAYPRLARGWLDAVHALFTKGGCLASDAHGTYTHAVLEQLQAAPVFFVQGGHRSLGWSGDAAFAREALKDLKSVVEVSECMIKQCFCTDSIENMFECFDLLQWHARESKDPVVAAVIERRLWSLHEKLCASKQWMPRRDAFFRMMEAGLHEYKEGIAADAKRLEDHGCVHCQCSLPPSPVGPAQFVLGPVRCEPIPRPKPHRKPASLV